MVPVLRIVLTAVAGITAYALVSVAMLVSFPLQTSTPIRGLIFLVCLAAAIGVGRLVWVRPALSSGAAGFARAITLGALIVGGVGFFAGFIGPIIIFPHSNQGPLLGIFITGPLGVVIGAIGGGVYWLMRRRRAL